MDLSFKYSELEILSKVIEKNSEPRLQMLDELETFVNNIEATNLITGSAANGIKNYYTSVYRPLIAAMRYATLSHMNAMQEYLVAFDVYDLSGNTELNTATLETVRARLHKNEAEITKLIKSTAQAKSKIADLLSSNADADATYIETVRSYAIDSINKTLNAITTLENSKTIVVDMVDTTIQDVSSYISNALKNYRNITEFNPEAFRRDSNNTGVFNINDIYIDIVDKSNTVREYEKEHPETAKEFDKFLNSNIRITSKDKLYLKYYAYTAPEPYRTIFLNNLKNVRFADENIDENESAYYSDQKIYVFDGADETRGDNQDAYSVVFHEFGHAIDDINSADNVGFETTEFVPDNGKGVFNLNSAIEHDVFYNRDNPHSLTSIANRQNINGDIRNVINVMRNGGEGADNLTENDRALRLAIRQEFNNSVNGNPSQVRRENYASVTDIYGGVTRNELRVDGFGHPDDYWAKGKKPGAELWAEYFADNMTKDESALSITKEYLPESCSVMDDFAKSLVK